MVIAALWMWVVGVRLRMRPKSPNGLRVKGAGRTSTSQPVGWLRTKSGELLRRSSPNAELPWGTANRKGALPQACLADGHGQKRGTRGATCCGEAGGGVAPRGTWVVVESGQVFGSAEATTAVLLGHQKGTGNSDAQTNAGLASCQQPVAGTGVANGCSEGPRGGAHDRLTMGYLVFGFEISGVFAKQANFCINPFWGPAGTVVLQT